MLKKKKIYKKNYIFIRTSISNKPLCKDCICYSENPLNCSASDNIRVFCNIITPISYSGKIKYICNEIKIE